MARMELGREAPRVRSREKNEGDSFDSNSVTMIIRRRKWLFAIPALLFIVCVASIYFMIKPTYTATAQIILNTQHANVVSAQQEAVTEDLPPNYAIDTQVEVLKSPDLAKKVALSLGLDKNPAFAGKATPGSDAAVAAASDAIQRKLKVERSGASFAIDISFNSQDPREAEKLANSLADQYLAARLYQNSSVTASATKWLQGQLEQLQSQVLAAETAVQRYRAANGLINTARDEIGAQQEMSRTSSELASARAELAEREAAARTARQQSAGAMGGQDVNEALNSNVVTQLRAQRAQISTRVAELEAHYGDRYPRLVEARDQLATIDEQIRQEVQRIVSGLEGQARVAAGRTSSLQSTLNQSTARLAGNSAASVKLSELERNAEALRTIYETYLARYRETSTQSGLEKAEARILTRASVPTSPSSPKLPLFAAIALTGGIAAGAIAVALREMLDRTLRSPDAILKATGLSTLASIPSFDSMPDGQLLKDKSLSEFLTAHPFSILAESLRMLQASLDGFGSPKVIAITSALPGEGKTSTAFALAKTAALSGRRALLVECDTRRDGGTAKAGAPDAGFLEVLRGEAPLDGTLIQDSTPNLTFLPLSNRAVDPDHVLHVPEMDRLLDDLRSRFDIVVLDLAPVLAIAEARLIASKADACCFVIGWGATPVNAAMTGLGMLDTAGAHVVGAVLSRVDLRQQAAWSRNDPTAYFKSMKGYYS